MNDATGGPLDYVTTHRQAILDDLIAFASIPSVSTDPAYAAHIGEAAAWVAERMRRAGLENIKIRPTAGHPIVTCEWLHAQGAPTVLIYGHYDVQPPDPLDKWTSPPFEPTIRDGCVFARGATDDKGQVFTHLKSIEAWMETAGALPVNVKFIIEGEEEVGSGNLDAFLE